MKTAARALTLATFALALTSCVSGERVPPGTPAPATHTVTIEGMRFQSGRLRVRTGDRVLWVNKDLVPHTSTSQPGGFDSALIEPGASWQLTAKAAGTFEYVCSFHPMMKGTLEVQ